jgi:hypothetical protein
MSRINEVDCLTLKAGSPNLILAWALQLFEHIYPKPIK